MRHIQLGPTIAVGDTREHPGVRCLPWLDTPTVLSLHSVLYHEADD